MLYRASTSGMPLADEMKARILNTFLTLMNLRENLDRGALRQPIGRRGEAATFSTNHLGFFPCVKLACTSMPPQTENKATASRRVLTIGHSNHAAEHFLRL